MSETEQRALLAAAEDADDDDQQPGTIEVLAPEANFGGGLMALGTLRQHVEAMAAAKTFADGMCYTALIPERFQGKPNDGAAAILFGAELGLSPIASLRSVIVIHGMPGLEARTMKALLKQKGYRFRTIERADDVYEIEAESPDGLEVEASRWTIEDAQRAGYVPTPTEGSQLRPNVQSDWVTRSSGGKTSIVGNMKYITEPRAMLKAKATAEVCRDIAPHILLGMPYSVEELAEFIEHEDDAPRRQPRRAGGVGKLRDRAAQAAGQGGGNDVSQGAESSSGVEGHSDSRDQKPEPESAVSESRPKPDTAQVSAPPADNRRDDDDLPMSPQNRVRGERMLGDLLTKAGISTDDHADRLNAIAEIVAKWAPTYRDIDLFSDLTNRELKYVVDVLRQAKDLPALIGEALNEASLREAGIAVEDTD